MFALCAFLTVKKKNKLKCRVRIISLFILCVLALYFIFQVTQSVIVMKNPPPTHGFAFNDGSEAVMGVKVVSVGEVKKSTMGAINTRQFTRFFFGGGFVLHNRLF